MTNFSTNDVVMLCTNKYFKEWNIKVNSKGIITSIIGGNNGNENKYEVAFNDKGHKTVLSSLLINKNEIRKVNRSIKK